MSKSKTYQSEEEPEWIKNAAKARNKRFARFDSPVDQQNKHEIKDTHDADKKTKVSDGDDKKDDDQNFITKDEKIVKKEGVLPEGNQQRNLDRETGGLEAEKDKGVSEKDAWDERSQEVQKMNEDAQDLNNASKSTRAKAFIYVDKQRKKKMKEKHKHAAEATTGYVARLTWRKDDEDNTMGGGRVI